MSSPYDAPSTELAHSPSGLPEFRLADARFLVVAVYMSVAAAVLATSADVVATLTMPGWNAGGADPVSAGDWALIALAVLGGAGQMLLVIPTAILFWIWIRRANINARALGAQDMDFTPGWCVGWWFVPFANLFKPYQAVHEVLKASAVEGGPQDWKSQPDSSMVTHWWLAWIFSGMLGRASFKMTGSENVNTANMSTWVGVLGTCATLTVGYYLAKLVREVQDRQWSKAAAAAEAEPPVAP